MNICELWDPMWHYSILVTYRVIQEESAILWEMTICVILSKKVHMNMGPILNGWSISSFYHISVTGCIFRNRSGTVQNRTHFHTNCYAQNHTYYRFPKYCRFLLNHFACVYI